MCATEFMDRGAVRMTQLTPESLECTETYETPDEMQYTGFRIQVGR
jgi:hypothetical protein